MLEAPADSSCLSLSLSLRWIYVLPSYFQISYLLHTFSACALIRVTLTISAEVFVEVSLKVDLCSCFLLQHFPRLVRGKEEIIDNMWFAEFDWTNT